MKKNPKIDQYLIDGCMRCKYGATDLCKVNFWTKELILLREIVLETDLVEELKWGIPVYTYQNKNILSISALKTSANLGFFKGALLKDEFKILQQQGNIQVARILKFNKIDEIYPLREIIKTYIKEAINLEKEGKKVFLEKNPEPIPTELLTFFNQDKNFEQAFYKLTSGKQRGYIIYFSQPKQSETKIKRIEKYKNKILAGIGIHDQYQKNK